MKKFLYSFLVAVFLFLLSTNTTAQVTYTLVEDTSLGVNVASGHSGFSVGDFDGDGYLDLFVGTASADAPGTLYKNDVNGDSAKFYVVSKSTSEDEGVFYDSTGYTLNCVFADFNGDGDIDILCPNGNISLYLNEDGNFVDVTTSSGDIAEQVYTSGGRFSDLFNIAASDYDGDGDVDLALAGGDASPQLLKLYVNNGDGTFVESSDDLIGPFVFESWNPEWVDFDNDGDLDLWVPVIRSAPELCTIFQNDGGGILTYTSIIDAPSSITSTWGDFNNDGYMDLWLTPLSNDDNNPGRLYVNDGDGFFTDIAPDIGMDSLVYNGSRGCSFGDFDNDGWLDLMISIGQSYADAVFWHNNGDGTFTYVTEDIGMNVAMGSPRSVKFFDYDNDGFLDIFVLGLNAAINRFYHNGGNDNHWIVIKPKAVGVQNTSALGARVRAVAGSLTMYRDIGLGSGGVTNGQLWAHFGLGSATKVDTLTIWWPTGEVDVWADVDADQFMTAEQGTGTVGIREYLGNNIPDKYELYQNYPNPFNPTTTIAFNLPVRNDVNLVLINILGQVVKEIAAGNFDAGLHEVKLNASELPSGVYFYRLEAGDFISTKKLILMK